MTRHILTAPSVLDGKRRRLAVTRERGKCSACAADGWIVAARHVSSRPKWVTVRGVRHAMRPMGWVGMCARCIAVMGEVGG